MKKDELMDEYEFRDKVLKRLLNVVSKTDEGKAWLETVYKDALIEVKNDLDRESIYFFDGVYDVPQRREH